MADRFYKAHIRIQAKLVLLLMDALTGQPAPQERFQLHCDEGIRFIRKSGGILVVTEAPSAPYSILVEGAQYLPKRLHIVPTEGCQVLRIWLQASADYPIQTGTVCISGRALPNSKVFLAVDGGEGRRALGLVADAKRGDETLRLYRKTRMELCGRKLCLCNRQTEMLVALFEEAEDGCYRLSEPLSATFPRIGTQALLVYEGEADAEGAYRMLVREPLARLLGFCDAESGERRRAERREAESGDTDWEAAFDF